MVKARVFAFYSEREREREREGFLKVLNERVRQMAPFYGGRGGSVTVTVCCVKRGLRVVLVGPCTKRG